MTIRLPVLRFASGLFAVLALVPVGFVQAQLPAGSGLNIGAGSTANSAGITINDPGNHTWVLQSSNDLATWSDVETLKVHNGRFQRKTSWGAETTGLFFRTSYDPSAQTQTSTLANALRLPATPDNYANPTLPNNFLVQPILGQDTTPANNHVTNAAATLGRVLFYDKRLSLNQTVSCSTCHIQALGFSDGKRFSTGFAGGLTARNSMGLTNARWYQRHAFFWDERAATLEAQVLMPIQNSVEMGMTLTDLLPRLAAEPFYAILFANAFGDAAITSDRISRALAQFVRSLVSTKSKYDIGVLNGFANFTPTELLGQNMFRGPGQCAVCHNSDNFTTPAAIDNNGLEFPYVDLGFGGFTGISTQNGKFKAPSLRNIELTAPYMHDGRFATLEEVVEFYNSGIVFNPNLSPLLKTGNAARRMNLTADQKAALVAFLKTLTDTSFTTDPKFSDPFNYGDDTSAGATLVAQPGSSSTGTGKVALLQLRH